MFLKKRKKNEAIEKESITDRLFSEGAAIALTVASASIFVLAVVIFMVFRSWDFSGHLDESIVGQFGDFIGGVVGTLLAFAAAILYYVALREQRKDVKINQASMELQNKTLQQQIEEFEKQKTELVETRRVYEQQTSLMKEQGLVMRRQQFESSFYSLVRVYMDLRAHIISEFPDFFSRVVSGIEAVLPDIKQKRDIFSRHEAIVHGYNDVFINHKEVLSPYFKTIYRILCVIDGSTLGEQDKEEYVKIFRAQLSDSELCLLFLNYYSEFSSKARDLAYKYNFLKHNEYAMSIDARVVHQAFIDRAGSDLMCFLYGFSSFLPEAINHLCDSPEEQDCSIEREFDYLGIICRIASPLDLEIELTVPKTQELSSDFQVFFQDFMCERVFLSQFRTIHEPITLNELGLKDSRRIYRCTIHKQFVSKLSMDSYGE